MRRTIALAVLVAFFMGACVSVPHSAGPSVPALMGSGKTPQEFERDKAYCNQQALARAGSPSEAAAASQVGSTVLGTLLGAALGVAAGAIGGSAGLGAAVGAGVGAIGGTAAGAQAAAVSAGEVQRRYNTEYFGCMYAAGHQVPGTYAPPQYQQQPPRLMPPPPPPPPGPR